MTEEKQKRVALYARVSTEEQAIQGYSITAQRAAINQYCSLYNKVVVDEYVDAGISGKSIAKRPELKRMLKELTMGKFDEVVVWKLNRLSRNTKDFLEIYEALEKNNIAFISLSENFDTSNPMGKFALQMLAAVGELERNTIVENVNLGLTQRARMGLHSGGRALGYGIVPSTARPGKNDMVIIESEAIIVRKIYRLFCEGKGFYQIAEILNQEGYKTIRGNPFSLQCIREIIDNPLYKGYVRYARYKKWSEKRRKGKNPDPIIVKGIHEPIVSEELWEMAASIRRNAEIKQGHAKVNKSQNIISGILRCPVCGASMVVGWSTSKLKSGEKRRYRYYACANYKNKGKSYCKSNAVNADKAEQYVIDKITEFISNPKLIEDVFKKIKSRSGEEAAKTKDILAEIKTKLTDIDRRKTSIMDLYMDGMYDRDKLDQRMEELNKNEKFLLKEMNKLLTEADLISTGINIEYIAKALGNFREVMSYTPPEQKQLLLRTLIEKITVKDGNVDKIYMKFGKELQEYLNENAPCKGELFLFPDSELRNPNMEVKFVL